MYVTSPISVMENSQPPVAHFANGHDCEAVTTYGHDSSLRSGQALFRDGDEANFIYEVVSGVVRTSKLLSDGRRQVLSFGYHGDIIGFSHDDMHHCDCEALADVKLRVVNRNVFNSKMAVNPALCIQLLKRAAAEVNDMQEHFLMLGRKSAIEKIASFLVVLLEREGEQNGCKTCFSLPMSRSDIADFLGLTIETVSRSLTKLRKKNIIELPDPHRVCVLNTKALRAYAELDA